MYTLKLDWSDKRIEAVTEVLGGYLENATWEPLSTAGMKHHEADVRGALDDILMYREITEEVIAEITARHGPYYQKTTNLVIEYKRPARGPLTPESEWLPFFADPEDAESWRDYLPVSNDGTRYRLVRRTATITDEVLGEA